MKHWLDRMSTRECALGIGTILVILCFVIGKMWVLPVYDQWTLLRDLTEAQQVQYEKLAHNLTVRDQVETRFSNFDDQIWQTEADHVALSQFLVKIEAAARQPSIQVSHMKPQPVRREKGVVIYPLRLAFSGKIQEVLLFVNAILNHDEMVTGLEQFSLRGVQGGHLVECNLVIWMVRLLPDKSVGLSGPQEHTDDAI